MKNFLKHFLNAGLIALVALNLMSAPVFAADANKEAKQNLEYMYEQIAKKLEILLKSNPEFLPFGAGMSMNGKVQFIWTDRKKKYKPEAAMVLVRQAEKANAEAGRLMAVATIYKFGYQDDKGKLKQQVNIEMEYVNGFTLARIIGLVEKEGELLPQKAVDKPFNAKVFTPALVNKLRAPAKAQEKAPKS